MPLAAMTGHHPPTLSGRRGTHFQSRQTLSGIHHAAEAMMQQPSAGSCHARCPPTHGSCNLVWFQLGLQTTALCRSWTLPQQDGTSSPLSPGWQWRSLLGLCWTETLQVCGHWQAARSTQHSTAPSTTHGCLGMKPLPHHTLQAAAPEKQRSVRQGHDCAVNVAALMCGVLW